MKKVWRKILVAWCTIAILIMISSVYVSADELIVSTAEEVILETNDTEQPNSDSLSAEGESSEPVDEVVQEEDDFREITDESEKDVLLEKDESTDALVGALESTGNGTLDRFINDSRFTSGVYWPSGQTPKIASYQGWGCCAYCADYVKYCLGINNPRGGTYFTNINEIRQGDVLIVGNPSDGTGHWFVCLKRSGNRLYVAEGNFSSHVRIGWNYTISGSKFAEDGRYFNCGYHFQLNTAPGAPSLTCRPGTSLTPTLFIWSNAHGATTYSLRIIKGECWVGENIKSEWNLTRTSSQVQLPAGYYEAYVDACNENGYTMSNIVKFNVQKASIANATITNIMIRSPKVGKSRLRQLNNACSLTTEYSL